MIVSEFQSCSSKKNKTTDFADDTDFYTLCFRWSSVKSSVKSKIFNLSPKKSLKTYSVSREIAIFNMKGHTTLSTITLIRFIFFVSEWFNHPG